MMLKTQGFGESSREVSEAMKKELLGVTKPKEGLPLDMEAEEFRNLLEQTLIKEGIAYNPEKLIADVKNRQRSKPTNPAPTFAHDLHTYLSDELNLDPDEFDNLKYYTAVGPEKQRTALDLYYNVQAFFEWQKGPKEIKRATFRLHHKEYDKRSSNLLDLNIYIPDDLIYPISYSGSALKPRDLTEKEQERYDKYVNTAVGQILDILEGNR